MHGEKAPRSLALGINLIEGFADGEILVEGRVVDDNSPLTHALRSWLLGTEHDLIIDRNGETFELT